MKNQILYRESEMKIFMKKSILTDKSSFINSAEKPRVLVTTDGEIDDECSLNRFLLYANEWDIEGIITTSSQYHWQGNNWAGDDWTQPYLDAYEEVYPNLIKHDKRYPEPEYLKSRTVLGNVKAEGEMQEITPGSQLIVRVLLDDSDSRPIWIQAWGGTNTIARALKTIEEEHTERMGEVAKKIRLYLIWEQDETYQSYIRKRWSKYEILTIISDQFIALFYHWKTYLPKDKQMYLKASWMNSNIIKNHGPLCALYKAHTGEDKDFEKGDFRSEGDSPAFLHTIPTGLRNMESPDWGGWGGRFVKVRENTWLDPVSEQGYKYPEGRWYTASAWGRERLRQEIRNDKELVDYLEPQWRWIDAIQKDWAARADWCVKEFDDANHPPIVKLANATDMEVRAGDKIPLSASGTKDPDGDTLSFRWWQYKDAGSYEGYVQIDHFSEMDAVLNIPNDSKPGQTIHIICEVTDDGIPPLTRYQRVLITII